MRRADMMRQRRSLYPKVKVYGLYRVARQTKDGSLLRDIKQALADLHVDR